MNEELKAPAPAPPQSAVRRWWIYQRERFPVVGHGPLIAAFSLSAVSFSALLRGRAAIEPTGALAAFGTSFLFFLQLRIADEFKDFDEDSRYRPYRPVPRGLVSLRELGVLGVLAALVQLGLALWLSWSLVLLLLVVWAYFALMSKEFFAGEWLRAHPIIYLLSHMMIMPLVDFYATACDWWPAGAGPPHGLEWFVAVSYCNGVVIEVGRKVRSPADEEAGVNTYSVLWGSRVAVAVWLGAMLLTAALAALAAYQIAFLVPVVVLLGVCLAAAAAVALHFLRGLAPKQGKHIEIISGVWTLLLYLSLGVVPLGWRLLQ
jgi:4-hydroxybenzoate polyprenyltransferase